MEKEQEEFQFVKKIKLTDVEKDLVNAIRNYMREGGHGVEDSCYEILDELKFCILEQHGYKADLGETTDWDIDSWESIIVFYDEELEKKEKQKLDELTSQNLS